MNMEKKELCATVREGYQILMRAKAEWEVPIEKEKIADFYQRLAEKCMLWASEVHGEMLRKNFLSLEEIREKSQFGTQEYQLRIYMIWSSDEYAAFVCESWLRGKVEGFKKGYHRISHVWNLTEQTALPFSQILKRFETVEQDYVVPFVPDGIYPEKDELVFFKNATETKSFLEEKKTRKVDKQSFL